MNLQPHLNSSVTYIHNSPASFKSQFLQVLMQILGKKEAIEEAIAMKRFVSEAARLPKSFRSEFAIQQSTIHQRSVWVIKPKENVSSKVLLYLHGGGYISNLTKYDWRLVKELVNKTNCSVIVPDYPLAPAASYRDVYEFLNSLYFGLLSHTTPGNIIFMGNSAGGGIALGFAQMLRDNKKPQPSQIILNSPWLDITLSNPAIAEIDKKDKLLGITGLRLAGELYAAGLDATNYRLSPIYGDCSGLGRISLFIGTHDLFLADARKFKEKLNKQHISINYFEYPKMFHVWIALTSLKESRHAIKQIAVLVKGDG